MTAPFENRQNWDLDAWPDMYGKLKELQVMIFLAPPGPELNFMVFTVASLTSGCRHCQAHGAYGLQGFGTSTEKIQGLWSFETSDLFDERERAALRFAVAASAVPNVVDGDHHAAIREHFSDEEARALLGVVSLAAFMNRYNDSLGTVTDNESVDWATKHLAPLGWDIGKHTGETHEQRSGPPGGS
jgi:alkylhydroperoxidase family enzyme